MDPVTLRTPRLTLHPPAVDDVDAITAACQDPAIQRYVPVPVPYAREDAVSYVTEFCALGWASGDRLTWAVLEGGQLVGTVGLHAIADAAAEIGYWLAPGARGRGIMREAAAAVVDHGFDASAGLGLARIGWRAYAGNTGSAGVARALGFRFEGVARLGAMGRDGREDDWLAGLLATDDWTPQPWTVLA
ncbi:GNAT family N-acetyltransferase [Clavibacter michiganensis]|uniref:GNAT family N-acetyltransferase n=1 Tax=Clavibacter michiganensis TaxID=28447 RepID=UPI0009A88A0D|nr:GNAT family N-acetyltransferase [Clavibacter michiganensis]MBE3079670.1 GNAT family N-acetyltransferase [Clavibacter michiganensis subsp. michiganensis]MBF4636480.1 GNAT family N-acetyltransferase [Clavibacter michiganensis subsp. michiganensis]MDO4028913.1 GNAT family N-acetyltransferase [Clavibacter michiganensis]MDO4123807.1 GNAT family N-acetyltransferase [Clavibacter michiganensis]MDO4138831.1 GNAT family N-acetyltransferase [Clavibacter michiganensis]